jgi:TonB-linked SusC/RagA family outer membrane protein
MHARSFSFTPFFTRVSMSNLRRYLFVMLAAASPLLLHAQSGRGIITGKVTEAGSGVGIAEAQLNVVGTSIGGSTRGDGTFTLRNVPSGTVELRVLRIGYSERKRSIQVRAGQTTTADFSLGKAAIQLAPIVTTATGAQRRAEVPNQISSIDVSKAIEESPIATIADALVSKVAGVSIIGGSSVGSGTRIRIRGTASLSQGNDPIYILDGVRISGGNQQAFGTGGAPAGRLNDINPEDIENIEVLRGPAASATYGTDAATGVIVITTKRGRVGVPRWNVYTEQGTQQDRNTYPLAYTLWGRNAAGTQIDCNIQSLAAGTCRPDSLTTFNVWSDPRSTPLKDGYRNQYGMNVSGGSDAVGYFVSAESEGTSGTLTIPQFELGRLARANVSTVSAWLNPNDYSRQGLRANLDLRVSPALTIPIRNYFNRSFFRNPQDGNNTTGLGSHAFGGAGTYNRLTGADTLGGYRLFTPGDIFQQTNEQETYRYIGAINPTYAPTSWLTTRAALGFDFTSGTESNRCLRDQCPNFGQNRLGFVSTSRTRLFQYTGEVTATASYTLFGSASLRSTAGFQYVQTSSDAVNSSGSQLPPGGLTISQGSVPGASEGTTIAKTAGYFFEQNLQLFDRLNLVGSVRGDQNSAFGKNFGTVLYPRAGVAYQLDQEKWFPLQSKIGQLRLRASWGQAGLRPGTTAALPFFAANAYRTGSAEVPGVIFQQLGDANLRPETVTEAEGGLDLNMFNDRFTLTVTRYRKVSDDAIVSRVVAPSFGTGTTTQSTNLGAVTNHGWEGIITVRPIDTAPFGFDLTVNGSYNTNNLDDLGVDAAGNPIPPIIGTSIRQTAGFPLNGYWQRRYAFNDANGDGLIAVAEIQPDTNISYLGYSAPRTEISSQAGVDLFNKRIRITALFDFRGGYLIDNTTERFRCLTRVNSRERIDPTAPLERQARCAAAQLPGALQTFAGYLERGDFVRFREIAMTWRVPERLITKLPRFRNATITASGRNLARWTKFTGVDPETFGGGLGNVQDEFQVTPPLATFALRFNLGF